MHERSLWQERKKEEKRQQKKKRWQELYKKTSKPAGNAARNKKVMVIAFLFRCYKTAQIRHTKYAVFAQFYIQGE
jgi:hypothetical protein